MNSYTVNGFTFTESELSGPNPYVNEDGTFIEAKIFEAIAFGDAQLKWELDNMSEAERAERMAQIALWREKMRMD
jgi:hypothetical protein